MMLYRCAWFAAAAVLDGLHGASEGVPFRKRHGSAVTSAAMCAQCHETAVTHVHLQREKRCRRGCGVERTEVQMKDSPLFLVL